MTRSDTILPAPEALAFASAVPPAPAARAGDRCTACP